MSVNAHELISATENIADLPKNADSDVMLEKIVSEHKPSKNPIIRLLWIIFGSAAVVLAAIGVFLPGWPTVSWLVFAGFAYGRSSQKLFRWLLNKSTIWRYIAKLLQKWKVLTIALKNCNYWSYHPCFDCIDYHYFKGRRPWLRSSNNRIGCHYRHMLVNMESSNNGMSYSSNFFPSSFAAVFLPAATSTFGNKP